MYENPEEGHNTLPSAADAHGFRTLLLPPTLDLPLVYSLLVSYIATIWSKAIQ